MTLRAIVLSFDRLHLGYLGCYGNDWIETPNFDRLATQSVVFDQHFAVDLRAQGAERSWWSIAPREREAADVSQGGSLPEVLTAAGVKTWLFVESDGSEVPSVAPPFDEIHTIRGADSLESSEDEPPFARLVETVSQRLPEITAGPEPSLVWLKSRGVPAPWLPPEPFADLYLDEFGLDAQADDETDEAAPVDEQSVVVPSGVSPTESAIVELKYARALYAAYVTWLDRWLGKLLRVLESASAENETLLIVTAARGQSLGERGLLDEQATPLRAELIHTPLFIRLPDRLHDATRRAALVTTTDLAPTLLDWFGVPPLATESSEAMRSAGGQSVLPIVRNEIDSVRDYVFFDGVDERGVRGRNAFFVQQGTLQSNQSEVGQWLFEKPADLWDMADVASQDPGECERLQELLTAR